MDVPARAGRSRRGSSESRLSASAGTIGSVPPERRRSGRVPSTRSNASWASFTAGASGGDEAGGRDDQRSTSSVGAGGRRLAEQPLERGRDLLRRPGPGASRIETFASRLDRKHRLLEVAARRRRCRSRPRPRPRRCARRTPRPRAPSAGRAPWSASAAGARVERVPGGELLLGVGGDDRRARSSSGIAVDGVGAPAAARAPRSARRRRRRPSAGRARRVRTRTWK